MKKQLRVLIVEDSELDAALMARELKRGGYDVITERVDSEGAFLLALEFKSWDLVLCDYRMPDFNGMTALRLFKERNLDIPLIMVSAVMGEDLVVEAMKAGADDYVMKAHLKRLTPVIERQLHDAKVRRQNVRTTHAVRESEMRYRSLFENMIEGYAYCKMLFEDNKPSDFIYVDVNAKFEELTGLKNVAGKKVSEVIPSIQESNPELFESYGRVALTGKPEKLETYVEPLGIWFSVSVYSPGKGYFVAIFENITERKRAEQDLRNSLAWQEAIFEGSREGIFVSDADSRLVSVNQAACLLTGYSKQELLRMQIPDLHDEEDLGAYRAFHDRIMAGEEIVSEAKLKRKDGLRIEAEFNNKRVVIEGIAFMHTTARNITGRKRAEQALIESEGKYRLLAESSPEMIYLVGRDGRISYVNTAASSQFWPNPPEIVGKHLSEIFPAGIAQLNLERIQKVIDSKQPSSNETLQRFPSGDMWVEARLSPVIDKNGEVVGVLGLSLDITERKKGEENLRHTLSLLAATLESTADGILVVDNAGKIVSYNTEFLKMWRVPQDVIDFRDDNKALEFVQNQLREPKGFLSKIRQIYAQPDAESYDLLEFKDGRTFERYSQPQRIAGKSVGRVWSFRDITEWKRAEEKYRTLFEESKDVVFISTPEGKFLDINPAGIELFGYTSKEELLSINITTDLFLRPHDRLAYQQELAARGFVKDFELVLKRKDGKEISLIETTTPVRDGQGTIVAYRGIIRDITEKKKVEEALELQRSYFQQLFENSPSGIVVLDDSDTILTANRAFQEMFQYPIDEIRAGKLDDFIVPDHLKDEGRELSSLAQKRNVFQKETKRRRKDGSLVNVSVTGYPIIINNDLIGIYGIYVDISAQRNLEDRLRQTQKMESIGTLAGGIAHDFNNILGIILGHTSVLERNKNNPEKVSQSTGTISKAVDRGTSLVRQLLTFARKTETLFESLSVNNSIEELAKFIEETFPENIEIALKLEPHLPSIIGDTTQVHQVLLNLSVNARDAMPMGGKLTFVTSTILGSRLSKRFLNAHSEKYVHVSVGDSGIGMDETTRSRIFEPFFTTKGWGKGTGLGLAVVYGVMGTHNSLVDVESKEGAGTTFHLYFPVQPHAKVFSEKKQSAESVEGGTETLLLVEDEKVLRDLLKETLAEKGYTVLTAEDGEQALSIYKQRRDEIRLVLSDMGLPKLAGYDLFKEMKSLNPGVKVILASGYLEPDLKSEILNAGVTFFIQKPYSPDEILMKVRAVLDAMSKPVS